MAVDDRILFAAEENASVTDDKSFVGEARPPWKLMIVDDEPEVHTITRLALSGFKYDERGLEFVSAFSGAEAKELLTRYPDIAMVFLDVVMETENSGLDVVRFIRNELNNHMTRIILRTGQPGQAPERRVVLEYDINDYKTKTELTAQKLFTSIVAGLRSYADLKVIKQNQNGLEHIINASASIFKIQSMQCFVQGVLTQLNGLLKRDENTADSGSGCFATRKRDGRLQVIAGTGVYVGRAGEPVEEVLSAKAVEDIKGAIERRASVFGPLYVALFFESIDGRSNVIYLEVGRSLGVFEQDLLNIFCANVTVAFDNINLTGELENSQKEVVERIGAVAETRSEETGNHVRRVAHYCHLLGKAAGMSDEEAIIFREAAPMHDIGKVGIPDSILNKPGKLTEKEFEIMKQHSEIGSRLLSGSKSRLLDLSAIVALEHHERYDGGGYPLGLKCDQISLYGRITAIADVFDALGSDRCYKKAWPVDEVFDYLRTQRAKQFDPDLVDLFLAQRGEVLKIRESFKD